MYVRIWRKSLEHGGGHLSNSMLVEWVLPKRGIWQVCAYKVSLHDGPVMNRCCYPTQLRPWPRPCSRLNTFVEKCSRLCRHVTTIACKLVKHAYRNANMTHAYIEKHSMWIFMYAVHIFGPSIWVTHGLPWSTCGPPFPSYDLQNTNITCIWYTV